MLDFTGKHIVIVGASIRCMAKEMAYKNICINSVAPSMIGTKMWKEYVIQNVEKTRWYQKFWKDSI